MRFPAPPLSVSLLLLHSPLGWVFFVCLLRSLNSPHAILLLWGARRRLVYSYRGRTGLAIWYWWMIPCRIRYSLPSYYISRSLATACAVCLLVRPGSVRRHGAFLLQLGSSSMHPLVCLLACVVKYATSGWLSDLASAKSNKMINASSV